jgi:hypothetical protein
MMRWSSAGYYALDVSPQVAALPLNLAQKEGNSSQRLSYCRAVYLLR